MLVYACVWLMLMYRVEHEILFLRISTHVSNMFASKTNVKCYGLDYREKISDVVDALKYARQI